MINYSFILVGRLPTTYDTTFNGARALPSLGGNSAILQYHEHLYELICNTSSCNWGIMEKKLDEDVTYAVMMYLPPGYTGCAINNWTELF